MNATDATVQSDEYEQPSYQLTATSNNQRLFGGQRAFYDKESHIVINGYLKFSGENDDEWYDAYLPTDIMWIITTYLLTSILRFLQCQQLTHHGSTNRQVLDPSTVNHDD